MSATAGPNSLKKDSNKSSGYRHVYLVSESHRGSYSLFAQVYDIKAGKKVYQGCFYTAYAAAVTAALCKTKGLQEGPRTGREAWYHVPRVGGSQIRACEMKKSRHKPTFWQRERRGNRASRRRARAL